MSIGSGEIRFLADENLDLAVVIGLRRRLPGVDFVTASDAGILGLPDADVPAHAAEHSRILVSHDKKTMPRHFYTFLASGHHSPGLLLIDQNKAIGEAIDALALIWVDGTPEEWRDPVTYLPL